MPEFVTLASGPAVEKSEYRKERAKKPVNSQNNSSAATGRLTCGAQRGNTALYVKYDVNVFVTVAYHPGKGGDITPIAAGKNDCSLAILKNAKQTQFQKEENNDKCFNETDF